MPVALLHRITRLPLPLSVTRGSEIDRVRILMLGGHLKATIPPEVRTPGGMHQPPATVTAITSLGRMLLRSFPLDRP